LTELWVISALIAGAALFGVQGGYMLFFRERKAQQAINRRLKLSSQLATAVAVLETLKKERGFADFNHSWLESLGHFWTQTGLRFDRNLLVLAICGLAAGYFVALTIPLGLAMSPLVLVLAVVAAGTTIFLFLHVVRRRRITKFLEQFPDTLDVIVRGVRVGLPFPSALELVAREMPDPVGTEFGLTADEIAFGLDVPTALENLHRRVGQEHLLYFVIAISIQNQTGGSLSEVLSRLSRLIRQRTVLRLTVKALTAEGRLSAVFLSAMPFILVGVITLLSPQYFTSVQDHPLIPPALVLGLISLFIGNVMIYRMVNFKY
jgi:tight adherence protein B